MSLGCESNLVESVLLDAALTGDYCSKWGEGLRLVLDIIKLLKKLFIFNQKESFCESLDFINISKEDFSFNIFLVTDKLSLILVSSRVLV